MVVHIGPLVGNRPRLPLQFDSGWDVWDRDDGTVQWATGPPPHILHNLIQLHPSWTTEHLTDAHAHLPFVCPAHCLQQFGHFLFDLPPVVSGSISLDRDTVLANNELGAKVPRHWPWEFRLQVRVNLRFVRSIHVNFVKELELSAVTSGERLDLCVGA